MRLTNGTRVQFPKASSPNGYDFGEIKNNDGNGTLTIWPDISETIHFVKETEVKPYVFDAQNQRLFVGDSFTCEYGTFTVFDVENDRIFVKGVKGTIHSSEAYKV